jgi:two-component system, LytTR family, response regulator AlgR
MEPLRILIVDDEPLARMRLAALLRDMQPPCVVAGEAGDAAQALAWLDSADPKHACDVLLLDIQMPGEAGTAFAARLRARPAAPALVFVTAHAEHALQAFELGALDYLTKPVRRERLQEALQRIVPRLPPRAPDVIVAEDEAALVVSDRGRVLRVPLAEVLYLKAELKYVSLRTAQRVHLLDQSLTELEPRLGQRFVRIHRNTLVARHALRALERRPPAQGEDGKALLDTWAVQVMPVGEWLAVSRRQLSTVREALTENRL